MSGLQRAALTPRFACSLCSTLSLFLQLRSPRTLGTLLLFACCLAPLLLGVAADSCDHGPPPLPPVVQVALLTFCRAPVGVLASNPVFGGCPNATALPLAVQIYHYGQRSEALVVQRDKREAHSHSHSHAFPVPTRLFLSCPMCRSAALLLHSQAPRSTSIR